VSDGRPDDRADVPTTGAGEREMLRAYLDFHRDTLAATCAGLSDDDLRARSVPPSGLSLLGLVRHLAEVERAWFRRVIDGQDVPLVWGQGWDFQAAYDPSGSTGAEAFEAWRNEVEQARRIEAAADSLDVTGTDPRHDTVFSLRRVMLHVLQEYARHNGHADLIRERIDGVTGI
jgi:uncharacterized damage-inducible protein DinB